MAIDLEEYSTKLRKIGPVGAMMGLIVGATFIVCGIMEIEYSKTNEFKIAVVWVAFGISYGLYHNKYRIKSRLKLVKEAEDKGWINKYQATACQASLANRLSEKVDKIDTTFSEFIQWVRSKRKIEKKTIDQLEAMWVDFKKRDGK